MSFGKSKNPLRVLTTDDAEDYHVRRLEERMRGDPGFSARCGCRYIRTAPNKGRVLEWCPRHKPSEDESDKL